MTATGRHFSVGPIVALSASGFVFGEPPTDGCSSQDVDYCVRKRTNKSCFETKPTPRFRNLLLRGSAGHATGRECSPSAAKVGLTIADARPETAVL
jgi:hypothetical protein